MKKYRGRNAGKSRRKPPSDEGGYAEPPIESLLKFKAGDQAFQRAMQSAGYNRLLEPVAASFSSVAKRFASFSTVETSSAIADC